MSISGPIFGSIHGERLLDELGEEYFCIPQFLLQDYEMSASLPCYTIEYDCCAFCDCEMPWPVVVLLRKISYWIVSW